MINARYTVTLKTLMDSPDVMRDIEKALSDYPLYEKKDNPELMGVHIPTREELNRKILNHYKYREIGVETIGRWLDMLRITMHEIMPYYNQLFFTVDTNYDIELNVDYTRERTGETSGENKDITNQKDVSTIETDSTSDVTNSGNSKTEGSTSDKSSTNSTVETNNKHVESGTPQGVLDIPTKSIDNVPYADKVAWNHDVNTDNATTNGEGTTSTETESSGTSKTVNNGSTDGSNVMDRTSTTTTKHGESSTERTKGMYGIISTQELVGKYRDIIINIEKMIIEDKEIQDLFMPLW